MNFYLVTQTSKVGPGTLSAMVIAAETKDIAQRISPDPRYEWCAQNGCWLFVYPNGTKEPVIREDWPNELRLIHVVRIGYAIDAMDRGVVLSRYHVEGT